jgi:hypothetical protein
LYSCIVFLYFLIIIILLLFPSHFPVDNPRLDFASFRVHGVVAGSLLSGSHPLIALAAQLARLWILSTPLGPFHMVCAFRWRVLHLGESGFSSFPCLICLLRPPSSVYRSELRSSVNSTFFLENIRHTSRPVSFILSFPLPGLRSRRTHLSPLPSKLQLS